MQVPEPTPVTTPEALTVAIEVFELVQFPPVVASDRLVVAATQAESVPVILAGAVGTVLTVAIVVTVLLPQPLPNDIV